MGRFGPITKSTQRRRVCIPIHSVIALRHRITPVHSKIVDTEKAWEEREVRPLDWFRSSGQAAGADLGWKSPRTGQSAVTERSADADRGPFVHLSVQQANCWEASEAYALQIASIEQREEAIHKAFVSTLCSLSGTIITCLLLALGLYWQYARVMATVIVISMIGVLAAMIHQVRRVS